MMKAGLNLEEWLSVVEHLGQADVVRDQNVVYLVGYHE